MELAQRRGASWHAYAKSDGTLSSSRDVQFWTLDQSVDPVYSAVTKYLLRFDVNTETRERVPFTVYIQPQVKRGELTITSNIEALTTKHTLILR